MKWAEIGGLAFSQSDLPGPQISFSRSLLLSPRPFLNLTSWFAGAGPTQSPPRRPSSPLLVRSESPVGCPSCDCVRLQEGSCGGPWDPVVGAAAALTAGHRAAPSEACSPPVPVTLKATELPPDPPW